MRAYLLLSKPAVSKEQRDFSDDLSAMVAKGVSSANETYEALDLWIHLATLGKERGRFLDWDSTKTRRLVKAVAGQVPKMDWQELQEMVRHLAVIKR